MLGLSIFDVVVRASAFFPSIGGGGAAPTSPGRKVNGGGANGGGKGRTVNGGRANG